MRRDWGSGLQKRLPRWPVALVLLAAVVASGGAQAQNARLYVLTDSVHVGERFEIAVAVDHGPGRQVLFPDVSPGDPEAGPLLTLGDVEAFDVRRQPPAVRGAVRTDSAVYTVAAFAVDSARVGPVEVRLAAGADTAVLQTGVGVLPVRSVLEGAPPHAPAPVGPPEEFPSPVALWAVLGALGVLLLAAAVWGLVRLLRQPEPRIAIAPYPAARDRLRALDAEVPTTPEDVEAHVVAVRETVRTYLGRRLGVPALEATTGEIDVALRADPRVPPDAADTVRRALLPTDLVAFAGLRLSPDDAARLRASAQNAVEAVEAAVREHERSEAEQAGGDGRAAGTPAAPPTSAS